MIGRTLGPYEIVELLGSGGMGEVYRAYDPRLKRDVAVKVLAEAFAADAGRLARLEREAHLLAALNHPNVATIHGLEETDGVRFLVLELVEGSTLADRVRSGPLGIEAAVEVARQIAQGLEAAHAKGILHRDLKPANVAITGDGRVKLLDFGLAKPSGRDGDDRAEGLSHSPTATVDATEAGVVLGTASYMSPEQARGEPVDSGTDIWAFGCVLYEMLTGHRAFGRATAGETLAQVLEGEPDFDRLPARTPPLVARLVRRCLEKDRRARLRHIGDAHADLTDAFVASADERARRSPWARPKAAWLAAGAVAVLAIAAITAALATRSRPPVRIIRATIPHEAPATLSMVWRSVALTPDGTRLVYVGGDSRQIFVRPLDAFEAESIVTVAEGSDLRGVFISPDGEWVGYADTSYTLKKIPITGGPPVTLLTLDGPDRGATWAADDTIVFATAAVDTGLQRIPADGGAVTVLTRPSPERGEIGHRWPDMLPDERGVLFTIMAASGDIDAAQVAVLDLASGDTKTLIRGGYARYVPSGHLVYATGNSLRAIAFDAERLQTTGTPVTVVPRVVADGFGNASFSLSADGTLVYVEPPATSGARTLVWVDRRGEESPLPAPPAAYGNPRISPGDETRLAFSIGDDLWVWDIARPPAQLTFTPLVDWMPLWMPDGEWLVYGSWGGGGLSNLYMQVADGTRQAARLSESPHMQLPSDVTTDGLAVLFTEVSARGRDLHLLRFDSGEDVAMLETARDERNAAVSPDRGWVAYESDTASAPGQMDVYVRPFPVTGDSGFWQVSAGGGTHPLWSRSGDELFYLDADGAMMSVPVETSGSRWISTTPIRLFSGPYHLREATLSRQYDVTSDGQRFLMIKDPPAGSTPARIVLVQGFAEELRGRVQR